MNSNETVFKYRRVEPDSYYPLYEVEANGEVIGRIERVTQSTDTKIGRLRRPGKGRPGWRIAGSSAAYDTRKEVAKRLLREGVWPV